MAAQCAPLAGWITDVLEVRDVSFMRNRRYRASICRSVLHPTQDIRYMYGCAIEQMHVTSASSLQTSNPMRAVRTPQRQRGS